MSQAGVVDECFEAIYERVGPRLFRVAVAITGDRAAAEDAVQEACVRVWRRRKRLTRRGQLDGYLLRATRNAACDQLRRRQASGRALERQAQRLAVRSVAAQGPDAERIAVALERLPLEQREVVTLRVFEELPFKEVARCVGVAEGTVHSRFRYGVSKLRELLGLAHEVEAAGEGGRS